MDTTGLVAIQHRIYVRHQKIRSNGLDMDFNICRLRKLLI